MKWRERMICAIVAVSRVNESVNGVRAMRIMLVLAAAAVLVSGVANADNPAPAKKDDSQKIICKTEEFVGSMIPKRVCMSRADWAKQAQMDKDAIDPNALSRARMEPPVVKPGG